MLMKDRLYNIMADVEDIMKQIDDMKNVLELQAEFYCGDILPARIKSLLNVQIRLLKSTQETSYNLLDKVDNTILDVVHNRL